MADNDKAQTDEYELLRGKFHTGKKSTNGEPVVKVPGDKVELTKNQAKAMKDMIRPWGDRERKASASKSAEPEKTPEKEPEKKTEDPPKAPTQSQTQSSGSPPNK